MTEYDYRCPTCGAVATFSSRPDTAECHHLDNEAVDLEPPLVAYRQGVVSGEPPATLKRVWTVPAIEVGNHGYNLP